MWRVKIGIPTLISNAEGHFIDASGGSSDRIDYL